MKRLTALSLLLGFLPWSVAMADLPYTFEAGDPIRASELNSNFEYLESLAATGAEGPLTRRRATLRSSGFNEVVTVPDTATNGWVLSSYVTGCGDPILRIDSDGRLLIKNISLALEGRGPGEGGHIRSKKRFVLSDILRLAVSFFVNCAQ